MAWPVASSSSWSASQEHCELLGRQYRGDALLLQQDHDEPRRLRGAHVAPNCVHIAGALIKSLPRRERDLLAAPDLLDDRPLQHVDESMRIMTMDVFHGSGGILDGDHHH